MASITEPPRAIAPRGLRDGALGRAAGAVPPALWTILALLVVWEGAVRLLGVPEFMLPAPSRIVEEIVTTWDRLVPNALVTLSEVVIGFALAVIIGVPLSVLIVYSRFMERAIYPLIVISQTIPKVAVAPLLLTWFGYGMTPKYIIVVLLSFFPIVINTVMGLKSSSDEMLHLARSMGASGFQTFWKFRLPNALPSIFAGLKLATVLSVIGATVAEFIGASQGLGYLILIAGSNFDVARQFAAIIFLSGIGMAFFYALGRIERAVLPWRDSSTLAVNEN
jgi:NitT/TauT family transport system permease protein